MTNAFVCFLVFIFYFFVEKWTPGSLQVEKISALGSARALRRHTLTHTNTLRMEDQAFDFLCIRDATYENSRPCTASFRLIRLLNLVSPSLTGFYWMHWIESRRDFPKIDDERFAWRVLASCLSRGRGMTGTGGGGNSHSLTCSVRCKSLFANRKRMTACSRLRPGKHTGKPAPIPALSGASPAPWMVAIATNGRGSKAIGKIGSKEAGLLFKKNRTGVFLAFLFAAWLSVCV